MGKAVLVIGAGGVGEVVVQKCAQNNDILGNICIASRTLEDCNKIIERVYEKNNLKDKSKELYSKELSIEDDKDTESVLKVIKEVDPDIVINVTIPDFNMPILDACHEAGVASKLVATVANLEEFAKGSRNNCPFLTGWRHKLFGRHAEELMAGKLSLSLSKKGLVLDRVKKN